MKAIEKIAGKTHITKKLYEDSAFRTVFITYISFSINIIYAVAYGVNGILKLSPWLGTFSAYYILLSLMRLIVLRADLKIRRGSHKSSEEQFIWRRYLIVGILLFFSAAFITTMNGVTGGLVCIIILFLGTTMTITAIGKLHEIREVKS